MNIADCVEHYVRRKQVCGYDYTAIAKILRRFARFVGPVEIATICNRDLNRFLTKGVIANNTWQCHSSCLRNFFTYWFGRREIRRIPKAKPKPWIYRMFNPHIYTREDIKRLLTAADVCQRAPRATIAPETLRTLVLFLYGTGVKIGDALALTVADIDFARSTIVIRGDSLYHRRSIPVSADVRRMLRRYSQHRQEMNPESSGAFFLTVKGRPIPYNILRGTFQRLCTLARLKTVSRLHRPGLRDLRHTFAVHSISQWTHDHHLKEKMMPILATYMGMLDMHGVHRYAQLSPSSFQSQLKRL